MDKHIGRDKAEPPSVKTGEPHPPPVPPKKPLPDLTSLGTLSLKPTRPPFVDLSCYYLPSAFGMLTCIHVFSFLCVSLHVFVSRTKIASRKKQVHAQIIFYLPWQNKCHISQSPVGGSKFQ